MKYFKGKRKCQILSKFVKEVLRAAAMLQERQFREQNVIYEKRIVQSKMLATAKGRISINFSSTSW
jgi:hypothetical protein